MVGPTRQARPLSPASISSSTVGRPGRSRRSTSWSPTTSAPSSRITAATRPGSKRPSVPTQPWTLYVATVSVPSGTGRTDVGPLAAFAAAPETLPEEARGHHEDRGAERDERHDARLPECGPEPVAEHRQ